MLANALMNAMEAARLMGGRGIEVLIHPRMMIPPVKTRERIRLP